VYRTYEGPRRAKPARLKVGGQATASAFRISRPKKSQKSPVKGENRFSIGVCLATNLATNEILSNPYLVCQQFDKIDVSPQDCRIAHGTAGGLRGRRLWRMRPGAKMQPKSTLSLPILLCSSVVGEYLCSSPAQTSRSWLGFVGCCTPTTLPIIGQLSGPPRHNNRWQLSFKDEGTAVCN